MLSRLEAGDGRQQVRNNELAPLEQAYLSLSPQLELAARRGRISSALDAPELDTRVNRVGGGRARARPTRLSKQEARK